MGEWGTYWMWSSTKDCMAGWEVVELLSWGLKRKSRAVLEPLVRLWRCWIRGSVCGLVRSSGARSKR